jgi:hypothetical protein
MRVIAAIPVHGRGILVEKTIERLLKINGCAEVVCAGDNRNDRKVCEAAGAIWVDHPNQPLGTKWNAAFLRAQELKADAVLFVGSSDWISKDWVQTSAQYLDQYGMTGKRGCHLVDFRKRKMRLVYWPGYKEGLPNPKRASERANEPIGIGRMLSSTCLDAMGWKPFDDTQTNSLDWVMYQKVIAAGFKIKLMDDAVHSMAVSCDLWPNKHIFEDHWNGRLPSERIADADQFVSEHFSGVKELFLPCG